MANLWYKCKGEVWCELFKLDMEHPVLKTAEGVYIIWTGVNDRKVLKVGSGLIRSQLMTARQDVTINAFATRGVFVTWSEVGKVKRDGVEAYLINTLSPLFVPYKPKAIPIKIKLPWEE
ncbi:MAG TPA: hypothetical protein PLU67_07640 [Candidatus Kapabacteria bacterium]|nr:hypothetical protein [Candidatus Kapabacteria bacterium]HOQ48719.1 hypothetical protein [Candidatus Kapabacteria bacterium]